MKLFVTVLCGITLLVFSASADEPNVETSDKNPTAQAELVQEKIKEHFPQKHPVMLAIANCESTGYIHWENGELRPNSEGKSSAAGVFQVLLNLHAEEIRRLGLDMNNIDDYMTFVKYLQKSQGYGAWKASKHCWGKRVS